MESFYNRVFYYRLFSSYWWRELCDLPKDFLHAMWDCLSYFPAFWKQCRCCDQTTFRLLAKRFEQHHEAFVSAIVQHVGHEKHARQIKTCQLLLERLMNDWYGLDLPDDLERTTCKEYRPRLFTLKAHYSEYMADQDMRLLTSTMNKYMRHWWI